ncbi:hypothetical protein Celaphus_00011698 [Cervus elaphus hippelaphus]|uniref:SEC7 domain-containing protein n=1 Tax=Cervus elaphus hippelaphus TaxID=46360 RepID=A0A212DFJ9_CEREH|nr:hypothetical protein Celaphus_00011698 [Cervus elaphus hippelaphus]
MAIVRKNFNRDPKKGDQVLGGEQTSPVHTLRGEGQKFDQMMEAFACGYCRCHPGIIQSTDAYYVLSFTRDNAEHRPSQSQHLEQVRPGALCGHEPAQQVGWDLPKELIWNF